MSHKIWILGVGAAIALSACTYNPDLNRAAVGAGAGGLAAAATDNDPAIGAALGAGAGALCDDVGACR
ncbi:hypothetical protein SAMN04490244_108150 [Tranquillimonas rosea]|uniref:YMGG-like Gly-zipper n=1 Tax=Tranquillimonas rosea TaxID=641238 RepID=A0A1H9VX81_9RHOB|nr:hypothetical protein [Tranquillimonas rosea]SES25893.1 hypothetical protein SAMN04490244_108150 [Tranquillimonas rosea]